MFICKAYTTERGFKVVEVPAFVVFKWGGAGVCDMCNNDADFGVFVTLLNMWLCPACFKRWHNEAENYPEDRTFERWAWKQQIRTIENLGYLVVKV